MDVLVLAWPRLDAGDARRPMSEPIGGPAGEERRDPDAARIDATVIGRVQGVGYRWFVLEAALRLGLRGWVANEADGSVRCVAEGPRADLETLLLELARGPWMPGWTG